MTNLIDFSAYQGDICYTVIINGEEVGRFSTLQEAQSFYKMMTEESKCEQV